MEENKDLVVETENAEQTAEASPKTYTEEEFNAKLDEVLGKKLARREAKVRKEYERKYGGLVETLKAGTGKESVEEINETLSEFYGQKGIKVPEKARYSAKEEAILAKAEADDIISGGFNDVVEELDRLKEIGANNMTDREKSVFKVLAEHVRVTEQDRTFSKMGVSKDVYDSQEFKDFAKKFAPSTPVTDIYDIYEKMKPKKEVQTMGSMKNTSTSDNGVKDFYTRDEALKFTKKDFDNNPVLFEAVQKSMRKW